MIKANDLGLFLISLSGVAYLWFGGMHLMGIHLPPIIAAIGIYVALTIVFMKTKVSMFPTVKPIFQVSLALIGWMFIRELAGGELDMALKVIGGRILVGLIIAFCIWFLTTEIRHVRFLTYTLVFAMVVSAIVGIGQFLIGGPFVRLWELRGGYLPKLRQVQIGYIAGLAAYSIPLGYQLCTCVPLVSSLVISRSTRYRKTLGVIFLLLLLALFLTQSRSAIIGGIVGMAVVAWLSSIRRNLKAPFLVLSLGAVAYLAYGMYVNPRMATFTEYSAQARLPLFIAAFWTGITHPLGTGRGMYREVAGSFYEMVENLPSASAVLRHTTHNQFLNMLGYYGLPGLVLLIMFYVFLFRLLRVSKSYGVSHPFLNGARIGFLGAFTGYLVNSSFHNAGPFIGDPFNWYFVGLALAVKKVAIQFQCEELEALLIAGE